MSFKGSSMVFALYWFAILAIVVGAVVYMASLFYGKPYDIREIESKILTDKIADCMSSGGYLRGDVFSPDFDGNFLEACDLNFNVEDSHDWKNDQYYAEIDVSKFEPNTDFGFGEKVSNIAVGNPNLKIISETTDDRRGTIYDWGLKRKVDAIVVHFTAGNLIGSVQEFRDSDHKSIHYIIDRDGTIISKENADEIVDQVRDASLGFREESRVASHAGCLKDRPQCSVSPDNCCIRGVNERSIGIELINWGFACGDREDCRESGVEINGKIWEPYTEEQINALAVLISGITSRHNIPVDRTHILGHEEVDIGRKSDPGPAFPWEELMGKMDSIEKINPRVGRTFYALDRQNNQYLVKILAMVGKVEKNV